MHCICRCARTRHRRHLTACHVHDFFSLLNIRACVRAEPSSYAARSPDSQTCTSITPQPSGSQGRGHTDSPDRRPGSAAALKPSLPLLPACEVAAAVSETHRPDVAVRSRPQLARSVLLRIHPLPAGGRDGSYIPPRADAQINKTNDRAVPCASTRSSCKIFSRLSGVGFKMRPSPPSLTPSYPPSHSSPISGVTSPCGYGLFSDTRIDQPLKHRCSCRSGVQTQLRACSAAGRKDAACSRVRVRARACFLLPRCRP